MAQTLLDYLDAGDKLEDFLEDFPTVKRDDATLFLQLAREESHSGWEVAQNVVLKKADKMLRIGYCYPDDHQVHLLERGWWEVSRILESLSRPLDARRDFAGFEGAFARLARYVHLGGDPGNQARRRARTGMKHRDLIAQVEAAGAKLIRHGGKHDI
jgi:hypothetical protein